MAVLRPRGTKTASLPLDVQIETRQKCRFPQSNQLTTVLRDNDGTLLIEIKLQGFDMSWTSTVDERYAGGYLSYSAGSYDAPYATTTAYKLAPRVYAYGALIPTSYAKDKDAYSLGILTPGTYAAFTSGYNWDYSNLIFASTPSAINLHDPTGAIVLTNSLGSLYFTVYQTGTFYISVEGSNYSSSEYSLVYTPNYVGNVTLDLAGTKAVGSTLNVNYSITDINGATNITPSYQWARSSDGSNWTIISGATSSSYTIQIGDADKYLRVGFSYTDNDGFWESFFSVATPKITPDTIRPTLNDVYPTNNSLASIAQNIEFSFSENIQKGTGSIRLEKTNGSLVESFDIASSKNILIENSKLILNPTSDLDYATQYVVKIDNSAIADASGNTYLQSGVYNFTTVSRPSSASPSPTSFPLTSDNLIDGMTNGYKWLLSSNKTIDWSISYGFGGEYWTDPKTVEKYVNDALSIYSYYTDIKFNYLGYFSNPATAAAYGSDINISMDAGVKIPLFTNSAVWAIGFFPNAQYDSDSTIGYVGAYGDIYLNLNSQANYLSSYEPGSAGWSLLIHELGHTLGLKHPHDDGGTGRPTFSDIGLANLNIDWATVMSYNDTADFNLLSWDPATPMILDVLALQYLYGKNETTNAGNTVYDLTESNLYLTIYDSSGVDELSANNATSPWTIFLPNTLLTNKVDTKVGFAAPTSDLINTPHTIDWLAGDIENVTGSKFNDYILGNDLPNIINGGLGDDTINGGKGKDVLIGDAGTDTAEFSYAYTNYTVQYINYSEYPGYTYTYKITLKSNSENQSLLIGFENIKFADGTYTLSVVAPPDTTAPSAITFSPADEATAVAVGSNIVVTFSENIQRGAGNIVLKTSDGTTVATYAQASSNVSISGNTLTINPTADLNYSAGYKVEFAAGSVQDLAGNDYAGTTTYNFTTLAESTAAKSALIETDEDTTKTGSLGGTDVSGRILTFTTVSTPSHGTVTINATTGAYTYTPNKDFNGTDSFAYKVNDGNVDSAAAIVLITVNAINDAPQAATVNTSSDEDTVKIGTLIGNDIDGNTLTFAKASDPSHGTVTINSTTGAYTYTPASNYNGTDSFSFKVNDGFVDSAPAIVSINVNAINDAPTVKAPLTDVQISETRSLTLSVPDSTFSDIDDFTLTYSAKLANSDVLPNWMHFNVSDHTFTISPGVDVVGTTAEIFTVEVNATDSGGLQVNDTFDVLVRPSGYDIRANVTFWKSNSTGQMPNLSGVSLAKGKESGTTTTQTEIILSNVEDTEGADDGFMSLSPKAPSPVNAKSAVNLTDVLATLKVYLGKLLPETYSSPLKYLAADFDANGTVELTDVLSLLKYYLGKPTTVAPSWVFVDAADFTSDGKSFMSASNQNLSKTDAVPHPIDQLFDSGHETIQIIGVLRGDVDGSWSASL